MSGWFEDGGLRWRPRNPFGVEVDHDLSAPLSPAAAAQFVELFRAHGMIVAAGQALSMEQQIALLSHLGKVQRSPDGTTYISSEQGGEVGRLAYTFHADYAFTQHPLDALSLHAVDVVDGASATRFASAERAYATMPAGLRERLERRTVMMVSPTFDAVATRGYEVRDPRYLHGEIRPTVLANPRSGQRCVGVGEMHATQLSDLSWEDSGELLAEVFAHLYAAENLTEHVWRKGDIVIWDNITFQHARGSIEGAGRRVLQRVAVGEKSLWEMNPAAVTGDLAQAEAMRAH
jgi:taurine dioxygenase